VENRTIEQLDLSWYITIDAPQREAIELLAVLEQCDVVAFIALAGCTIQDVEFLLDGQVIVQDGNMLSLPPALLALARTALRERPEHHRTLLERSARYYATVLHQSETARPEVEHAYMRHMTTLCEMVLQHQPESLALMVKDVPFQHVHSSKHNHLLRYYQALGAGLCEQFGEARAALDRLLAEPLLDDTTRGRALNSGATFARHQGDYERALQDYRASYELWHRLGNPVREGLAQMNEGLLHYYLQAYDVAERELQHSLSLFRAEGATHHQGMAHTNLGLLARDRARWDEALEHFAAATTIFEREESADYLGRVANNLGEVELLRGDIHAAAAHFERALHSMTSRVYHVDVHVNLGLVAQAQGEDAAALGHYQSALELADDLKRHEIAALIHYRIGHAHERMEQFDAASTHFATAIAMIEASRAPLRDEGLMVSLMGRSQQVYEAAVQLALRRGAVDEAFDYAERARARVFADLLLRRNSHALDGKATPATAAATRAALPPKMLVCTYFAMGLQGPEEALLQAIPREAKLLRACFAVAPQLILFTITQTDLQAHNCSLDPHMLQASSPFLADGRRFLPLAVRRRLYRALIMPTATAIKGADAVVFVPHGPLHQLPFAALLDENDTPLLEHVPCLMYAPSVTVFLSSPPRSAPPAQPCLAIGFDAADEQQLRHTEAEATTIAELSGGEAWVGGAGVCKRLLASADRYRWLHLACHGEFDQAEPLQSALVLGPDERLSASDVIEGMRLHADLVTLSACRSGVSRVLRGDEAMGLVRAFLMVGARAVLVTLWPVEDTSARLFMERLYGLLLQDVQGDVQRALHLAQTYLRDLTYAEARAELERWGESVEESAWDDDAQPYAGVEYWAPYVLVTRAH
jgi:CHAT domain-containing protein/tetratricopeptide (TPR) repeat protein